MKRKKYGDYTEAIIEPEQSKWVTDGFVSGRRIALYGIDIALVCNLDGKVELNPVIPCAGSLAKLVKSHPQETAFEFNRNNRKWRVMVG